MALLDGIKFYNMDNVGDDMTDWEIKLNNQIESVKNNPEEIKKLIKEYIKEFGEVILERSYREKTFNKSILSDIIEWELSMARDIDDYNTDLFNQY